MNIINESLDNIDRICEGLGCDAKVTSKVAVKVGATGTIFLFLCDNCKSRFSSPESDWDSIGGKV